MRCALAMVTDKRGYWIARYAMASALLTQTEPFVPHLFVDRWGGPAETDGLVRLARNLGKPLHITEIATNAFSGRGYHTALHGSSTAYLKLDAMEHLSMDYDRALYADTDTLFYEPVPISAIDFLENPVAAVYDLAVSQDYENLGSRAKCYASGVSPHYFNAGVMLFNFAAADFSVIRRRFAAHCDHHQTACHYTDACTLGDQCAFNLTFENRWTPLPLTWNVQSISLHTDLWKQAAIRHYTGLQKFLPLRAHRADKQERLFLTAIARALGDPPPRLWPGMGALYWANALRRTRARGRIRSTTHVTEANIMTLRAEHAEVR